MKYYRLPVASGLGNLTTQGHAHIAQGLLVVSGDILSRGKYNVVPLLTMVFDILTNLTYSV